MRPLTDRRHARGHWLRDAGTALALGAVALAGSPGQGQAAEANTGVYLLGFRSQLAGYIPPPGLYLEFDYYQYDGNLGGSRSFASGGLVAARVKQQTRVGVLTPIWVTPVEILGGNLGFSLTGAFGKPDVSAGAAVDGPRLSSPIGRKLRDGDGNFGDVFATTFIGWHAGKFHWSANLSVNIPSGSYQLGQLSNMSLNRPAIDVSGAFTYFDPERGHEISIVPGFTFNWRNDKTDYTTGTEFHLEGSVSQFLSKDFSIGAVGYYYQQLTADTGAGNSIGPNKGRVAALGGQIGYNFKLGDIPINTRLRVLREFEAKNRFTGTLAYLTVSVPLLSTAGR